MVVYKSKDGHLQVCLNDKYWLDKKSDRIWWQRGESWEWYFAEDYPPCLARISETSKVVEFFLENDENGEVQIGYDGKYYISFNDAPMKTNKMNFRGYEYYKIDWHFGIIDLQGCNSIQTCVWLRNYDYYPQVLPKKGEVIRCRIVTWDEELVKNGKK